ncbi:MAG: DNA gyrase subunit B [Clostridia bacterium]|nr:DNA gyrase subunit B [Clostridia bacterium]
MSQKTNEYKAEAIEILEGLDAVRMRPGMYIGSTGSKGLHHILWEIVDNAVDEAANGFATKVRVELHKDGSASVEDNGRGIPVDIHPQLKVSGVEVVFTQLHAGGKFNNKNYSFSGGLHGVGASVANALSEWLTVEVYQKDKVYGMRFESYFDKEKGKVISGAPKSKLECKKVKVGKTGTRVSFLPDTRVFGNAEFSAETITKRLKELAFLNRGILFEFINENDEGEHGNATYKYDGGVIDFVSYLNENKTVAHPKPIYFEGKNNVLQLQCSFQYCDSYTENICSYVNNIPTPEGGMHETGLKSAFTKWFNDYARKTKVLKDKDENFAGEDFREGLTLVLSVKMANVQFEGQTKTKLGNPEARTAVESILADCFEEFFRTEKGKTIENILKKAVNARKAREAARRAKEETRKKNSIDNATLVGKLASCTGRDYKRNELFIVEGDSAGGSAKQARDRKFQGILPLRGKPLNVEKKRLDQVLANDEFRSIIAALGTSIGEDFDITSLKYDKVIILADADQDGAHIRAILLTFFYRYMKELITEGHVYIGMPPLYKVSKKDTVLYAYDDNALQECMDKVGKSATLQRYKGLGEMNPQQLWDTTMDPKSRKLMRVTLEDVANAEKMLTILMGDSADLRKAYITEHANFNKDNDKMLDKYGA